MKTPVHFLWKAILPLICGLVPLFSYGRHQDLFKIVQEGKTGYINKDGVIVIAPKYINGGEFTDGLAPVRLNGLFGYINEKDSFVIQPQFDYAMPFYKGVASVYKNGKAFIIDRENNLFIDACFKELFFKDKSCAIVITQSDRYGVINLLTKKLIVDTVYNRISDFQNGVAIAKKKVYDEADTVDREYSWVYSVIDSVGNTVVPFGKYEEISGFTDGYSMVQIRKDSSEDGYIRGVIDTKGKLLFQRNRDDHSYMDDEIHSGIAKINLYKYWLKEPGASINYENYYEGCINTKGAVVYNDSVTTRLNNFSCGRALIPNRYGRGFRIIDSHFNTIGNDTFITCLTDEYVNNYVVAEKNNGVWGLVDTNGRFIGIEPDYDYDDAGNKDMTAVIGGFLFFLVEGADGEDVAGIIDLSGKEILSPIMQDYDREGFKNGLLKAMVNNRLTYIDTLGNIVWQERRIAGKSLKTYNIDYMKRGYFYAYSRPHKDDPGGHGNSANVPKVIWKDAPFPSGKLAVLVNPDEIDSIDADEEDYYKAMNVYISNTTGQGIEFDAQDCRLYMKVQAQNVEGKWKDIEYLPSSWCGNSYHILTLDTNSYWKFYTPVYSGAFKTKFRIELKYIDPDNAPDAVDKNVITIYSNEYDGSINPAQFWRKLDYRPHGIMDPYYD